MTHYSFEKEPDVVLIGAGIMSATLGALLKELDPGLSIEIIERLDVAAAESSDAWNNAGTGHSAFCELNYTPQLPDGSVNISKAITIAESFEVSKQFWAFLAERGILANPESFITRIPHMSLVWGEENVQYLRTRYEALFKNVLFADMQYSEDPDQIEAWVPVTMRDRDRSQPMAATRMEIGTDVNFGALTRSLLAHLQTQPGVSLNYHHEVRDLDRLEDGRWRVALHDNATGANREFRTRFVFIGAGGGALPLLQKSGIPEAKGYGGFPVSGQWLVCTNPELIEQHYAKVYGKASVGTPPMSVPHLDTRMIDGERALLFGPYAGFSTKFLKHGSLLDMPFSVRPGNVVPMLAAGVDNIPLTKYLIEQVLQSEDDRIEALRAFIPDAKKEDWKLEVAGQRVQVIKRDPKRGGVLEFGTEVISAGDGSLAALLGASPGASTAVSIMLTLIGRCFGEELASPEWQAKLKNMIPTYGESLSQHPDLTTSTRARTSDVLGLSEVAATAA